MDHAALNDISDVQTLRAMVVEKLQVIAAHEQTIAQHEHTITFKDAKIDKLTHEIARLRRVQFAVKSERMDPAQRELFDEAMAADIAALEAELASLKPPSAEPAPRERHSPARRTLPADLPRIETIHEPASCDCVTCGAALVT